MRYVFDGITLAMGKIVHGVDAPFVARAVMMGMFYPVHQWIAHVHVNMSHVHFCAQYFFTILVFALFHFGKQLQIFFYAPIPIRIVYSRLRGCTFLFGYFFARTVIYVSKAIADQRNSKLVELLKIIGGIKFLRPVKAEPLYIIFNAIYIFRFLRNRVSIIKA